MQNKAIKFLPNEFKNDFLILAFNSIPLVLSSLIQIFFPIISIAFCGFIGTNELDACSLSTSIINVAVFANIHGLTSAADTLFPQIFGGNDKKRVGLVLQKGIIISLMSSLISASLLFSSKRFLINIIHEPEILDLTDHYLVTSIPSIVFYSMATLLSKYLQSQNIIYPTMFMNLLAILFNFLFHYHFIIDLNMGVKGAAMAVNLSTFLLMAVIFFYIYFNEIYQETWPGWSIECLYDWKEYLFLGVPGFLGFMIDLSFFEIGTFAAGNLGKIELGVMSISQEVLFVCFQINYGIGIAGNIYIGQLLGSNKPEKAKNATKVVFFISTCCSIMLFLIVYLFSNYIPMIFSKDAEIITETGKLLKLIAFVHLFDGTQGMFCGILKAVGAQLYSSMTMFVSFYIIGSIFSLGLLFNTSLGVYGFFIGILIAESVLITLQIWYIRKINWKLIAHKAHDYDSKSETMNSFLNNESASGKLIENQGEQKTRDNVEQIFNIIIYFLIFTVILTYSIITR